MHIKVTFFFVDLYILISNTLYMESGNSYDKIGDLVLPYLSRDYVEYSGEPLDKH